MSVCVCVCVCVEVNFKSASNKWEKWCDRAVKKKNWFTRRLRCPWISSHRSRFGLRVCRSFEYYINIQLFTTREHRERERRTWHRQTKTKREPLFVCMIPYDAELVTHVYRVFDRKKIGWEIDATNKNLGGSSSRLVTTKTIRSCRINKSLPKKVVLSHFIRVFVCVCLTVRQRFGYR